MKTTIIRPIFLTIVSVLALSSCGSGSGSSNKTVSPVLNNGHLPYPGQGVPNTVLPGTTLPSITLPSPGGQQYGFKNFQCQMQVRKGTELVSNITQRIMVPQSGGKGAIFATTLKSETFWKVFRYARWVKLAQLNLEYTPGMAMDLESTDMVRLSMAGIDGDTSVSVTGFAGSENRLEVIPNDSTDSVETTVIVSCRSMDSMKLGQSSVFATKYHCQGQEVDGARRTNINFVNELSDVVSSGVTLSDSVYLKAQEIQSSDLHSYVDITQSTDSIIDSAIRTRNSLAAPVSLNIEKLNYSLKLKCQKR